MKYVSRPKRSHTRREPTGQGILQALGALPSLVALRLLPIDSAPRKPR